MDGYEEEFDYEAYEKKCDEIREANDELLELFYEDLVNLSDRTRRKHVNNVGFYINEYLLREQPLTFDHGITMIDDFLGYFFIRKCMWSTPGTIKTTAASIKKFYKCMVDHGKITKADYQFLCDEIKEGMPQWQADCEMYNVPEQENPFAWF